MYFGEKEFSALRDSRIWDAYQANTLSIYSEQGIWWYEKCPSPLLDKIVRVRMAECFPDLDYLGDITANRKVKMS